MQTHTLYISADTLPVHVTCACRHTLCPWYMCMQTALQIRLTANLRHSWTYVCRSSELKVLLWLQQNMWQPISVAPHTPCTPSETSLAERRGEGGGRVCAYITIYYLWYNVLNKILWDQSTFEVQVNITMTHHHITTTISHDRKLPSIKTLMRPPGQLELSITCVKWHAPICNISTQLTIIIMHVCLKGYEGEIAKI